MRREDIRPLLWAMVLAGVLSFILGNIGFGAPPQAPPTTADGLAPVNLHKCVACGFNCECKDCKCPQAATGRVKGDDDNSVPFAPLKVSASNAAKLTPAGTVPKVGQKIYSPGTVPGDGMWFKVLADGSWEECVGENEVAKAKPSAPKSQYMPAGQKYQVGGWWYTSDGNGTGSFCVECNGMTLAQAQAWVNAHPTQPGGSPGQSGTPATIAPGAGGLSSSWTSSTGTGRTRTVVLSAVRSGNISGCVSGG